MKPHTVIARFLIIESITPPGFYSLLQLPGRPSFISDHSSPFTDQYRDAAATIEIIQESVYFLSVGITIFICVPEAVSDVIVRVPLCSLMIRRVRVSPKPTPGSLIELAPL